MFIILSSPFKCKYRRKWLSREEIIISMVINHSLNGWFIRVERQIIQFLWLKNTSKNKHHYLMYQPFSQRLGTTEHWLRSYSVCLSFSALSILSCRSLSSYLFFWIFLYFFSDLFSLFSDYSSNRDTKSSISCCSWSFMSHHIGILTSWEVSLIQSS